MFIVLKVRVHASVSFFLLQEADVMECTNWSILLFYVISTFSPPVSSKPNVIDLFRTKVFSPRSADPPSATVRHGIFRTTKTANPFFLRSADPLSTRSPENIRFGRSVNEQHVYDDESNSDLGYNQIKTTKMDDKDILCMYPREDDTNHLLCVSPHNITDHFYAIAESPSEDESQAIVKPNHTDVYLRSIRDTDQGDHRVRKSKGTNFLRFGKAATFNRFDRGRDNFLRFGRSDIKRKSSAGNFIRFGRAFQKQYYNPLARFDYFTRLNRNMDDNCETDECVNRDTRGSDNFLRFGRASDALAERGEVEGITHFDRDERINDANEEWIEKEKRSRYNTLLKPGQRGTNFLRLGRSSAEECEEGDEHCTGDSSRFKRSLTNDSTNKKMKMCLNLSLPREYPCPELIYSRFEQRASSQTCKEGEQRSVGEKCEDHPRIHG